MTDSGQFGGKGRQFGDRMRQFGDQPGGAPDDSQHCAECEARLADALDGTLSAEEQARFDAHSAGCEPCGQMVADARRGAAWLELLRNPAPQPPADLLERILAETGWSAIPGAAGSVVPAALLHPPQGMAPAPFAQGLGVGAALTPGPGRVLAFPRQTFAAVRRSGFGQIVLQPRLAMTAAMAFFSIALTMNITGIHPTALRLSDLQPSSLRRDFFSADARVVQYYEGLRVVYELESRVHDLQSAPDDDTGAPTGNGAAPAASDPAPAQPAAQPARPNPNAVHPGSRPESKPRVHGKADENPRASRRDDLFETHRVVVAEMLPPRGSSGSREARSEKRVA
ncbi:MAG TPA: anti-sigma factor [Acidobacteriaceae bacterium]|nr:anti-sigma factor [Acidobacteriaceae bacterium]